jgi:hypothetical protein
LGLIQPNRPAERGKPARARAHAVDFAQKTLII